VLVVGYIFYTSNVAFKRMRSLYDLAFSSHYREELVLNGAANSIHPGKTTSFKLTIAHGSCRIPEGG